MNAFSKLQPTLEILLLEDNLDDALLVELELQRAGMNFRLQHVTGEKGYHAALKNYAPDVILSDFILPQYDGHAALKDAALMSPGTPVIIVTGSISEEVAVRCMQAGAADYVLKPNLVRLAPAIRAALERRQVRVEKQLAEKALRESERRFRNLADTTPMLIWMCGSDARFTYLNQPWLDFTGRSREEELGDGWATGIHHDDLNACVSLFHQALARREAFKAEYRLRRSDGVYRWMLTHGTPRFFNGGVFAGFVGSSVDITERKQMEKALRDSDARKSAIFNAALDCIITLDYEGRIVECNPAAESVFGLERDEVLGDHMAERMIPPDLRAAFRRSLEQYPTEGGPDLIGKREEFAALRGDGTEFQVEMTMTRIDMEGPPMFTVYLRDITERRQHEREREQLIRELQDALAKVKTLSGLVPVCASCKKIRDDDGRWNQMEVYIKQRTNADFTHGYCPDCACRVRESFGKFAPTPAKV